LLAAAFNAGDLDAFVEVNEENAKLIVPPDASLASGRVEIRRVVEPTFALEPMAKIEVAGSSEDGLALTHARWTLVGTKAEGRACI
jgi:ketosteroid isomerase-like protein